MKKCIWYCCLPMKRGQWDNNYKFYDDGTIEHEYDVSVNKYNLVSTILPSEINTQDKNAILKDISKCPIDWRAFVTNLLQPTI